MPQSASTTSGLSGAKDPVVWQRVCQEHRFFITLGLDLCRYTPISPRKPSWSAYAQAEEPEPMMPLLSVLRRVLREYPLPTLSGSLAVADEQRTRIRRPSP
jgi:hypothetical protein